MRLSCNGCRVLRKGCSENCSIRPCLQWIKNTESQANATVFLAKFYGRAGLMNLINAGPDHLRPAIFRSLLYEACGRIVNPIYGSVGLLWSGSWQLCQAAVDAVLKGAPIIPITSETAASSPVPPLKGYDIRHVTKDSAAAVAASRVSTELHKVNKTRTRFKRTSTTSKPRVAPATEYTVEPDLVRLSWPGCYPVDFRRAKSHESSASHMTEPHVGTGDGDSRENESMFSVETVDASHVSQAHPNPVYSQTDEGEVELELTLGFHPADREPRSVRTAAETRSELNCWDGDTCRVDIGLELPA